MNGMTKLETLIDALDQSDILYIETASELQPAKVMRQDGCYAIFFDETRFASDPDRFVALAHEKGHCEAGAVYTLLSPMETRGRCEAAAWRRAVLNELPFDRLMQAFESCKTADGVALHDLADALDVTPEFILRAIGLYTCLGKQILQSDDT